MHYTESSKIEYQGIAVVKKDVPILSAIFSQNFPNLKIRPNLHLCLEYFGTKRKIDDHIHKAEVMFPYNQMGKQIELIIPGIGYYKKDGKLMNVAALVDEEPFYEIKVGDKTLADYNKAEMPWITLYTDKGTYIGEDEKEHPLAQAKKSGKCFGAELAEDEKNDFILFEKPVHILGELCAFVHGIKVYRVQNTVPRLSSNKVLRNSIEELMAADIVTPRKEKKSIEITQEDIDNAAAKVFGRNA